MRIRHTLLLAVAALLLCAAETQAQAYFYVSPSRAYYPPAAYGGAVYVSPYGYRTYSSAFYPRSYGPTIVYRSGSYVRPFYSGAYLSHYYDPYAGYYYQGPGYYSAPYYSYYRVVTPYYGYRRAYWY